MEDVPGWTGGLHLWRDTAVLLPAPKARHESRQAAPPTRMDKRMDCPPTGSNNDAGKVKHPSWARLTMQTSMQCGVSMWRSATHAECRPRFAPVDHLTLSQCPMRQRIDSNEYDALPSNGRRMAPLTHDGQASRCRQPDTWKHTVFQMVCD